MNKIIYLLACFAIDTLMGSIFPQDYANIRLSFISNMGIVGIMFVSRGLDIKSTLLLAFGFGFFIDLTHYSFFLLMAFSYTITLFVVRNWSNQINESIPEIIILGMLTIFIQNFIVFIVMRYLGISQITFLKWFSYREFLTLIGNVPLILLAYFGNTFVKMVEAEREYRRRRSEKTLWMKVSNPFE